MGAVWGRMKGLCVCPAIERIFCVAVNRWLPVAWKFQLQVKANFRNLRLINHHQALKNLKKSIVVGSFDAPEKSSIKKSKIRFF